MREASAYRRAPHLVAYWKDGTPVVRNFATGAAVAVPASLVEILQYFERWRGAEEFAAHLDVTRPAADRLLARLTRMTLLQTSDSPRSRVDEALDRWGTWNPVAGFFHMSTRDVRFVDPIEGDNALRRKARRVPLPATVKRYRGAPRHPLPPIEATGEFPRVLLGRRTWRQFGSDPMTQTELGSLLGLTGGIQHWAHLRGQGDLPLKTSPSGGARHPIELYVCVRHVAGLQPGLYHYDGDRHRLERLAKHARPIRVQRYLPTQFWYSRAAIVVFFSAVFARYLWKYDYPRAYRAVLIEAGHQCQTFCLVAEWLGLAPFCSMALADSRIEQDLGLDGVSESVLYAAGAGSRPSGALAAASKPSGFPRLKTRANPRLLARSSDDG